MPSDDGRPPVPPWLERSAAIGVRVLALALLVWLVAELIDELSLLVVALLVALLLAGVLAPTVAWAAGKGVPRWCTAAAAMLLLLVAVTAVVAGIGARVAGEIPQLRDQLQSASSDLSRSLGIELPSFGAASKGGSGGSSGGSPALGSVLSSAEVVADVLIGFFLTLVFGFLLLKDGPEMWRWMLGKLGGEVQEGVDAAGRAAWGTVGAYMRGLTIVAVFDGVGVGLGLLLLGVPLALTLGLLQFLASYVPTIGAFVAGGVAVLVAYVATDLTTAMIVLGLVVVVQQVGNSLIEPFVMGRQLPLNAAVVLVAVTAGGLLWGIAGALLFVPLAAALSAAAHELWVRHGSRPIAGASV